MINKESKRSSSSWGGKKKRTFARTIQTPLASGKPRKRIARTTPWGRGGREIKDRGFMGGREEEGPW